MKKNSLTIIPLTMLLACVASSLTACTKAQLVDEKPATIVATAEKRCFILDTDWLADVDDAVAVRYLVRKHLADEITMLGINVNAQLKTSGPSLDSFVANEGIRLPVAVDHEGAKLGVFSAYHSPALRHGGGSIHATSLEYDDSVTFYRKTLAELPEGIKCDVISVGFMNSLERLLNSVPDEYSPLSGQELVREKVGTLWAMAGSFPKGKEFNIRHKKKTIQAATTICERWETPIVFLGFECGKDVKTGGTLRDELGRDDLLFRCMRAHGSASGRSSWDPMTAYLAVNGSPEAAGFSKVVGKIKIFENGKNEFIEDSAGTHCYVVKEKSDDFYEDRINEVVASNDF